MVKKGPARCTPTHHFTSSGVKVGEHIVNVGWVEFHPIRMIVAKVVGIGPRKQMLRRFGPTKKYWHSFSCMSIHGWVGKM